MFRLTVKEEGMVRESTLPESLGRGMYNSFNELGGLSFGRMIVEAVTAFRNCDGNVLAFKN